MLYELFAIVRPGKAADAKDIARSVGSIVLSRNGVIRDLKNWGTFLLPKPVRQGSKLHIDGQHFVMRFDSSPSTQEAVRKMLGLDPRMIRYGIVKISNQTLPGFANYGPIKWTRKTPEYRT